MSWPAISARSSCGMTVSSNPCRPGQGSRPSRRAASRLARISWRRCCWTWPAARSSPTVLIVGAEVTPSRYCAGPHCKDHRWLRLRVQLGPSSLELGLHLDQGTRDHLEPLLGALELRVRHQVGDDVVEPHVEGALGAADLQPADVVDVDVGQLA